MIEKMMSKIFLQIRMEKTQQNQISLYFSPMICVRPMFLFMAGKSQHLQFRNLLMPELFLIMPTAVLRCTPSRYTLLTGNFAGRCQAEGFLEQNL